MKEGKKRRKSLRQKCARTWMDWMGRERKLKSVAADIGKELLKLIARRLKKERLQKDN